MDLTDDSGSSEQRNVADGTALELLRQIITLASGVLALSAAFIEKFSQKDVVMLGILALAWISLIVSVFSGLQAMSAMVKSVTRPEFYWSKDRLRRYAKASKLAFIAGLAFFAVTCPPSLYQSLRPILAG